jgi:RimJ/RimL family protein N-acetyltransferase
MDFLIETDRLLLRRFVQADFDDLCEMLQDLDVMSAWEHTFSDAQVQDWLDRQLERYKKCSVGYWAAVEKESGKIIGQIGLVWSELSGETVLEPGYILKKACWHKGFALEGAKACVDYAFNEVGVKNIYISIRPENIASLKIAEKLGAKISGKHYVHYNNKDMLHLVYTMEK